MRGELIEDDVRCVGRHGDEVDTGAGEPSDGVHEVLDQRGSIVLHEADAEPEVEAVDDEARARGLRRLALLGTRFTMEAPFYPAAFARRGIAIVPPDDQDRPWVHERYLGELVPGVFKDETRERFVALIERLKAETGIDGVILGGTELPILLQAPVVAGLPMLDTTELHVQAIVSEARRRT